jgi:type VI secretion system protein ImpK
LLFALLTFAGLKYLLSTKNETALMPYQNVISAPAEEAHITIHLP